MNENEYVAAAFASRQQAVKYRMMLQGGGIPSRLITTPKGISSGCGIAVRLGRDDAARAAGLLMQSSLPSFKGFYLVSGRTGAARSYSP